MAENIIITEDILKRAGANMETKQDLSDDYHFWIGNDYSLYVCIPKDIKNMYGNEGMALLLYKGAPMNAFPCLYWHQLKEIYNRYTGNELTLID